MVFEGADDDLVARLELMLQTVSQQVEGFGAAAGEDDLLAIGGVQPVGDLFAYGLEGAGGAFARQVLGTVHIGSTVLVIVGQRRNHRLRLLRSGGAVQIGLTSAGERGKGRKVGTPGGIKLHVGTVGWVERSDTHKSTVVMGISAARFNPSYKSGLVVGVQRFVELNGRLVGFAFHGAGL